VDRRQRLVDARGRLREQFGRGGALQALLLRYLQALLIQTFQNTRCNRRHTVEERLSRWLLTARDRVQSDELELTHEFIARMLGTRRPGISEAVGVLRQAGLIDSTRGHFTIRDPGGLEARACECYAVVCEEYTRIFGSP
jgi:CRP-like cAMP-binding protein